MKYKRGDRLTAFKKTSMGSFDDVLSTRGKTVGLSNILPITGKINNIVDDHYEFKLDSKFIPLFYFKSISMNESDFVDNNSFKQMSDKDFII